MTRRVGIFKHSINDQYGFWLFDKKEEAIDKIKIALDDQAEVDSNDFLRSITYTKQQYKEFFHSLIQ